MLRGTRATQGVDRIDGRQRDVGYWIQVSGSLAIG
jgi:hypothetical protein